jgi:hypothetical protein
VRFTAKQARNRQRPLSLGGCSREEEFWSIAHVISAQLRHFRLLSLAIARDGKTRGERFTCKESKLSWIKKYVEVDGAATLLPVCLH